VAEGRDRVASGGRSPPLCAFVCAFGATDLEMQAVCCGGACRRVGRCDVKGTRDFFVMECAKRPGLRHVRK
jgi:hypothetical protein